jgi:hypothetical protein
MCSNFPSLIFFIELFMWKWQIKYYKEIKFPCNLSFGEIFLFLFVRNSERHEGSGIYAVFFCRFLDLWEILKLFHFYFFKRKFNVISPVTSFVLMYFYHEKYFATFQLNGFYHAEFEKRHKILFPMKSLAASSLLNYITLYSQSKTTNV